MEETDEDLGINAEEETDEDLGINAEEETELEELADETAAALLPQRVGLVLDELVAPVVKVALLILVDEVTVDRDDAALASVFVVALLLFVTILVGGMKGGIEAVASDAEAATAVVVVVVVLLLLEVLLELLDVGG